MNKSRMMRALAACFAGAAVMSLSGCSYFQIGEEQFSCTGMPDSVYCHSTREVYESTDDGAVPTPMHKGAAYNEECTDCVKSPIDGGPAVEMSDGTIVGEGPVGGSATVMTADGTVVAVSGGASTAPAQVRTVKSAHADEDEMIRNYVTPALPERPVPIRTPSQVMRIWVAPYIDTHGDYNAPGYVYTEIEPRRWVLAKEYENASRVFRPLEKKDMAAEDGPDAKKTKKEGYNSLERLKAKTQAKAGTH